MILGTVLSIGNAIHSYAAEPLKIGLILPMTGPYATYGKKIENGVRLYLAQHGKTIAGREVEIITADDTGVAPELDKRLAHSLIVKDKVEILAGFGLTPGALTVAPLVTQAKIPMIVMNAASSGLTLRSPYLLRTSSTQPQFTAPMAIWASKNGIKNVYILVAYYCPGLDSEAQFKKTFTAAGGTIVGSVHYPLTSADPSPYLQKIKDTKPDAVFVFLPPGELSVSFVRGFVDRGLTAAGIKLIGTSITEEGVLDATGDKAIGLITAQNYSAAHPSPENIAYVSAYRKAYAGDPPNYMSIAGYDGMALIAHVLAKTKGNASGDVFMAAAKGISWVSPRGPVSIDQKTRDIVQTVYIRKTEKIGGALQNTEFDSFPASRDPSVQ